MNSNLQPIKLFLVVAFSCTSLLVSLTPVVAKPNLGSSLSDAYGGLRLRSNPKTTLAEATNINQPPLPPSTPPRGRVRGGATFNQPSLPPGPPPGGRVRGGAKRGEDGCPLTKLDLTALVPFTQEANSVINVWGQTTVERPSWFFYVPYSKDFPYAVEFVLQDQDSNEIYRKAIALPDKPGVIRVSLPTTAPALAIDKQYHWFFTINCDKEKNSPPTFVEGVIQRVGLNPATVKELQMTEPLKRYAIYAQNGIWYEALTTLAELRQKNSQDKELQAEWQNLLGSIKLNDVAREPLVPETPKTDFKAFNF